MFRETTNKRVGALISLALISVTLFVTPSTNLDPINVPKFWALFSFGFAIFAVMLLDTKALFQKRNLIYLIPSLGLFVLMIIALLTSDAPIGQQLFGTNGRNTGLFTYLAFVLLFLAGALATSAKSAKYIMYSISGTLGVSALYGLVQATGNDPINWSNPYSPVIGTLGNPNFAAAFLGMGVGFTLPFALAKSTKLKFRILAILYIVIALFDISKSDAQQGFIVAILSTGLVGYFWIRANFKNKLISYGYLLLGAAATFIGILGTLQKGPLSSLLYKPSVTYRGDYWKAGLEMIGGHPVLGVGLDSYGDWYRSARTIEATLRRGPSTVSNAAHNVFIDIGATSGLIALIAYLMVIALGFRAMWRINKRTTGFDPFIVAIFVGWVGYLIQSIISINNIGLGIWGWVLPGILIAIDRWLDNEKTRAKAVNDFSSMAMVVGFVIGGVIGFMPFNADANFRHSVESGDAEKIMKAANKWPQDVSRLIYASNLYNTNKMEDKGYLLAKQAVELNPRSFDAWNYLYSSKWASDADKSRALESMKRLDPHNPDLAKLG